MIPRYSRPEMTKIWEPENKFRIWFEIEAHACVGARPSILHEIHKSCKFFTSIRENFNEIFQNPKVRSYGRTFGLLEKLVKFQGIWIKIYNFYQFHVKSMGVHPYTHLHRI